MDVVDFFTVFADLKMLSTSTSLPMTFYTKIVSIVFGNFLATFCGSSRLGKVNGKATVSVSPKILQLYL